MNRYTLRLAFVIFATGSIVWNCALAEVTHRQINAQNLVVDVSDDSWQPEGFENGTVIPATYLKNGVAE